MVPTVNDVALTGPAGTNPWPRGPNTTGGYQLDGRIDTLQEQARGALINHAGIKDVPLAGLLDDLASFQRVLFTNHRVRALSDAVREGTAPLPDRTRRSMCSSSRGRPSSNAPAHSVTVAPRSRTRR